jgi:hypothetical protein
MPAKKSRQNGKGNKARRYPMLVDGWDELVLIGQEQTSNGSTGEGGNSTGDQRRESESRDIATSTGRDLTEHTNLGTERSEVCETAKGVGSNETGARREVVIVGIGLIHGN